MSKQEKEAEQGDSGINEEDIKLQWYGSALMVKHDESKHEHVLCTMEADEFDTAMGRLYIELMNEYPKEEWRAPDLVLSPIPAMLLPDFPHPVVLNSSECPDCGNPEGRCEDPSQCEHAEQLADDEARAIREFDM